MSCGQTCFWALMDKKKSLGQQTLCRGLSGGRREVKNSSAPVPKQEAGAMDKVWLFVLTVKSLYILRTSMCTGLGKDIWKDVGHFDSVTIHL